MDNGRFIKNNKCIKDIINLINNFLVIKGKINKITIILISLKSLLFLSL